jgi:DNA-binding PucR family transcriptional regulator
MREDVKMVEEELERLALAEGQNELNESNEFGLDSWATLVEEDNTPAQVDVYEKEPEKETEKKQEEDKQPSTPAAIRRTRVTIIHKRHKRSFWGSIGEALDLFSESLLEQ